MLFAIGQRIQLKALFSRWSQRWRILPISAIPELTGASVFAMNLLVTFTQPSANLTGEIRRPRAWHMCSKPASEKMKS